MSEQRIATRKGTTPINVWVTPEEKAQIEELAKQTGHSMSSLLRTLGMGYLPTSVLDSKLVLELVKINADQGRLGGLLKMWLTNDERFAGFDQIQMRKTIEVVLSRIQEMQQALLKLALKAEGE
ncbi:plasmid mobilization protein [Metapseudomonas furukawaii]|uniref:plasmid mobilization protein n=1 Tax=Metapseudomonas furukawaii TaxID=1149133 RepID=UPI0040461C68